MKNFQAYLWWPSFVKPQVNTFFRPHTFFPDDSDPAASLSGPSRRSRSRGPERSGDGAKNEANILLIGARPSHRPNTFCGPFLPFAGSVRLFLSQRAIHRTLAHTHHLIRTIYVKMEKNETFFIRDRKKALSSKGWHSFENTGTTK